VLYLLREERHTLAVDTHKPRSYSLSAHTPLRLSSFISLQIPPSAEDRVASKRVSHLHSPQRCLLLEIHPPHRHQDTYRNGFSLRPHLLWLSRQPSCLDAFVPLSSSCHFTLKNLHSLIVAFSRYSPQDVLFNNKGAISAPGY